MRTFLKTQLLSLFTMLLVALVLYSCKEVLKEIIPSEKFLPYISAYSAGPLSTSSTIRVELAQSLPSVELNTEVKGKPFKFTPSVSGKAYWVSNNTIEFVPEEGALEAGKMYEASFNLGDFVQVEKDLRKFVFTFSVLQRQFTLGQPVLTVSRENSELVSVTHSLTFSDVVDKSVVEKMVSAKVTSGQQLNPLVEATNDPALFLIKIEQIERISNDETLTVEVNGKPAKVDNTVTRTTTIIAKDRFEILDAVSIEEPEYGVRITFSEALEAKQNLKGLVEIKDVRTVTQIDENNLYLFFEKPRSGNVQVEVSPGIKSSSGKTLQESKTLSFTVANEFPQVKMDRKGTILPDADNLLIPFQAVSLRAVDLSVIRIYQSNVMSFLQINGLDGASELRRTGRLVYKTTLDLTKDSGKDITEWEDYFVDLSGLIQQEPGAIYRIMLSFKQEYSVYPCGDGNASAQVDNSQLKKLGVADAGLDDAVWDEPYAYYNPEYEGYDWNVYDWKYRDDPCHPSYYMDASRKASCNVLATNLGLIAKQNSNRKVWLAVSDILTTNPVEGADVTIYNYQLQPVGTAKTDANGFTVIDAKGVPFLAVAALGKQKTYLRLNDGLENSTSRFDVGGKEIRKGLKGFIYSERGVWRPGDTLHVSFVLHDMENRIPSSHPVSIELYNPLGQFYTKQVSANGLNGFYAFHIPTKADDPTGLWNAYVKVGGTSFHKALRIETVKPNRLKINLDLGSDIIKAGKAHQAKLSSSWLTGATAGHLKANVEMKLSKVNTQFANYTQYIFNNPATDFTSSDTELFAGTLNAEGEASFTLRSPDADGAPGLLNAHITTRVFEPGGDASINTVTVPFSPFDAYVGINLNTPKDQYYIETDTEHRFDVITLTPDGKPINRSNLEYKIYKLGWSWWWEHDSGSFSSYVNNTSTEPVKTGRVSTVNGKTSFTFTVDYPAWGRYLVYVKDKEGGHATGGVVFIDWPSWRGRSTKTDPNGLTMLSFSLDKESYEVGEKVIATLPASSNGRALVAIENGSTVLHREWIQVSGSGDTKYEFTITPEMAPNVYLHVSLLQPHSQTQNDLPLRMYGVMPVMVTNKATILEPQIKMPDVLRPETPFTVSVSEKSGKAMTYTLAIVDDGLLDLTNFKTPNPWTEFYAREALGIRTWDMFDEVIGAYAGSYGLLFGTGGDEMLKGADAKANRFRPVVKYYGPFALKKGEQRSHKIELPMYVGSVRTMVVAGEAGAFGNAEKTTPVRSPLMLLSTLPRVLSTNEEVLVPVNVFAMESEVKNVTVQIEASSNLILPDGNKKSLTFAKPGDELVYFRIKTGSVTGKEIIKITAAGNGQSTYETIEIDVRNPNPMATLQNNKVLNAGQQADFNYSLSSNSKDNWVRMEVSRIPQIDFSRRFDFLYSYIHCCTEQLTSKAMPLLFIPVLKDINSSEEAIIKKNVVEGIKQLYGRQLSNGGFVYWPGNASADEWITSYAGNFLVLAKEMGYEVNPSVLNKWKSYQRSAAQNWTPISRDSEWYYWQSDLQQAYRLYTLALAGAPELGAMNRMKEVKDLSLQARWRLAAAYAICGKKEAANELIFNASTVVDPYSSSNNVYGSNDRDEAMILEALAFMGRNDEAFKQAKRVSESLSRTDYFSTQSTAFSLMAMARFAEKTSGSISVEYTLNGTKTTPLKSAKAIIEVELPTSPLQGNVAVRNKGEGIIFVNVIARTQLLNDTLQPIANNLKLDVRYEDVKGAGIQVDKVKQGSDFVAVVKVTNISANTDYQDIALTHIIPAGWEIYNERMSSQHEQALSLPRGKGHFDYQDIRDDKVLTYFALRRAESKEFRVRLQATYVGSFVLPAVQCEAMYDVTAHARTRAGRTEVVR